ncbi:C2H2-type zinc-finger domain-containing protein [Pochonia chlamydosporia 170]|uniref:C2H2-type zinc-finger domain-containing protein n=1 Tax=Pochonia chlamydosporia 170 TaxID=1380566 RepID=A0A179EYH6_METCM|nr:C2H2-type zinc-finger domain-containing protein [Pochonia chlamydosporia 170]OAQ58257.1 C2H2-type zinc-finger domain-containing protein [Pochonia chlamydosporia 170]
MESDIAVGPFTFLQVYRTLVCRECAFAVLVNEVSSHLVKRHQEITATERRNIVRKAADLPDARRIQADLQGFCFPPPTIDCVPHLAPPKKDGLKCHKCPYIARQVQKIQKHCKLKHKWENPQGPGRPDTKRKRAMQNELSGKHEGVHCQRFFPTRCTGWFEVGRKAIPQKKLRFHHKGGCKSQQATRQRRHTVATEIALQEHLEAALGRHQQLLDAQQLARICAKKMGNGSLAVMSPWLERTQWRRIYKNVRRDLLKAMVRLPLRDPQSQQWAAVKLGQGVADGDAEFISSQTSEERIACRPQTYGLGTLKETAEFEVC